MRINAAVCFLLSFCVESVALYDCLSLVTLSLVSVEHLLKQLFAPLTDAFFFTVCVCVTFEVHPCLGTLIVSKLHDRRANPAYLT